MIKQEVGNVSQQVLVCELKGGERRSRLLLEVAPSFMDVRGRTAASLPTCLTWAFKLRPNACELKLSRVKTAVVTGATGAAGAMGAIGTARPPFASAGSMMQSPSQDGKRRTSGTDGEILE